MRNTLIIVIALFLVTTTNVSAQKATKETFTSQGKKRTFYLFVPPGAKESAALPVVITLHGSGRDGLSLVERWKELAAKEGVVVAGPDSKTSAQWSLKDDPLELFSDLVEELKARKLPVNTRRVYLFGHSAGASFALLLALYEPRYFAATAIHAGALAKTSYPVAERAERKVPISIFVGTQDPLFPLSVVRETRDALKERGFAPELKEIAGHDHWYYNRAGEINRDAWAFLRAHELGEEPRFEKRFLPGAAGRGNKEAVADYNRGVELYAKGDIAGAAAAYTKAVEREPEFAAAWVNRGVARSQLRDYEGAVADLSRGIELDASLAAAYVNRGSALRALKRTAEALADYTRAAELEPSAAAFFNRAAAHEETGELEKAFADYTRALELQPKLGAAHVGRGIVLLRQGRDAEAEKDLKVGFELDPSLRGQLGDYVEQLRAANKNGRP